MQKSTCSLQPSCWVQGLHFQQLSQRLSEKGYLWTLLSLSSSCSLRKMNSAKDLCGGLCYLLAEPSQEKSRWMLSMSIITSLVGGQNPLSQPGCLPETTGFRSPTRGELGAPASHSGEVSYFCVCTWEGWEDGKKSEKMYVSKYFKEKRGKLIFKWH